MVKWSEILLAIDVLIITDILWTKKYLTNLGEPWQTLLYLGTIGATILLLYLGWIDFKKDFKENNWKAISIAKLFIVIIVLFVVVQLSIITSAAISKIIRSELKDLLKN